jgi:hypothetical protein
MSISKFHLLTLAALFSFALACGSGHGHSHDEATDTEEVDKSGPEYTSAYICPMHCKGSGSDQAGTCPVCGMDYVVNDEKTQAE